MKPQSTSVVPIVADVVFLGVGLLVAARFILGYDWPVWQKALALLAGLVFMAGIAVARWKLRGRNPEGSP
jgi:hypothetical protein